MLKMFFRAAGIPRMVDTGTLATTWMDVRVRLVFTTEVGRHVQRYWGFSSCWYLVPKDVNLVGDLAYVLLREFGLRRSCPKGLELYLEDLPVLATQSVRIVRDNDTIVVHCAALEEEEEEGGGSETTSSLESEVANVTLRKRKTPGKKEEPRKKKAKMKQDGVTKRQKDVGTRRGKSRAETIVELKSSSSGSSSSSSSSESEDKDAIVRNRKRGMQVSTTNKVLRDKHKGAATACNAIASTKNAALKTSGKEPRRRRRRLRQRSGGRRRNGNQASTVDSSVGVAPSSGDKDTASQEQEQVATVPQLPRQTFSTETKYGRNIAGAKGKPRGKIHVLFDEETGDQVEVIHDEHQCDARENVPTTPRPPVPELAKYGPSSSITQRSSPARDNQGKLVSSSSELVSGYEESSTYNNVPKREEKGKYVERWKRPYKIVATVLDKKSEKAASTSADLTKLLSTYPTAPATSFPFVPKDVIAFKTLTLCLETWQPVLSEWQCGQVQSTDASGNAFELSTGILAANGDSIDFCEARIADQHSVQTSEISELRFLSGPSYSFLQQTAEKNAS